MTKIIDSARPSVDVASPPVRTRILKSASLLGAACVLTFIAWGRLPTLTRETVWAEDGGVFLRDVLRAGHLQSIFLPYDGYLHVLPRLLASTSHALVPLEGYATAMSLLSCAVVAGISIAVFHFARVLTESASVRLMIAAIPILLPIGPNEVSGNAANLHWYLLWLAPWLMLKKPGNPASGFVVFMLSFLTAASEIISGMFLPLAVLVAWKQRNYAAPGGLLLGLILQIITTLVSPRFNGAAPHTGAVEPLSVVMGYILLPIGSIWHPDSRTLASGIVNFGAWIIVIPTLLFVGLLAFVLAKGTATLKFAAVTAIAASGLCWTASVVLSGNTMFNYSAYTESDWANSFAYIRYAAAPGMFLLLLVPLAIATAMQSGYVSRRSVPYFAGIFVVFLLISYFPTATTRQTGPAWAPGVEAARAACSTDSVMATAVVVVAPSTWKFAQVEIACRELRGQ